MWIQLAVLATIWTIQYLRRPKPAEHKPQKFTIPALGDGVVQPLVYGLARVRSPRLIWAGYKTAVEADISPGDQAFAYRLAMSWSCGLGGGAAQHIDDDARIFRIWRDESVIGNAHGSATAGQGDGFQVDSRGVAPEGQEGLVQWQVSPWAYFLLEPGALDQVNNSSFEAVWSAAATVAGRTASPLPDYRGHVVVHAFSKSGSQYLGVAVGGSPDVPRLSFEIRGGRQSDASDTMALERIGDGDENPAVVIYDLLTNDWGRLGLDPALIDDASFAAAGATLLAEQHGYSRAIDEAADAIDVIEDVIRQIDGVLYREPTTGLFTIKLVRDDYTIGALPVFDADNVLEVVNYSMPTWEEAFNVVRVTYEDRARSYAERVATRNSQGLLAAMGRVRALDLSFAGCKTAELAGRLASRELRAFGLPLANLRIAVNRDGFTVRPGDPIVVDLPGEGINSAVYRVAEVNLGTLDDRKIILDCVQDAFHYDGDVAANPEWDPPTRPRPFRVVERWAGEAPRWIQRRAFDMGRIPDPDAARGLYLAVPRGTAAGVEARVSVDGGVSYTTDVPTRKFPATALVETAYSRALDPYDTVTGLRITGLEGGTLASTADGAILLSGRNLAMVVDADGNEEIIGFGAVTDEGGGVYTLGEVWRGLLDTAPADHAVGERVYFLGAINATTGEVQNLDTERLGTTARAIDDVLTVSLRTLGDLEHEDVAPWLDTVTVGLRALKPLPVADLKLDGSKTPAALTEEGTDVTWRRRLRTSQTIVRGDTADQTPGESTTYSIHATRGDGLVVDAEIVTGVDAALYSDAPLGVAGYGAIEVSVRSHRTVTLPDGSSEGLASHQDPSLVIEAPEWRNQIINPRGAGGVTTGWTLSGTGEITAQTSGALGGAGYYFASAVTDRNVSMRQNQVISGYWPERMRATVVAYGKNLGSDADDTLTIALSARDAADAAIGTQTYGPTAQSTTQWLKRTLTYAALPALTHQLRVFTTLDAEPGGDTNPQSAITEYRLMVGQFTDDLIANGDFETGLTSWTSVAGTFTTPTTAPIYTGAQYAKGDAAADSEYRQDYAVSGSVGYEVGATVVLELARMNDHATLGTGTVTVECRDGSGVLASATTGAEHVGTVWVRRRLTVEIPVGTTTIRVRLISTRTSATASACFDDVELRLHKHLEPDADDTLDLSTPDPRPLPVDRDQWDRYYPTIDAPDLGLWDGSSLQDSLGRAPTMEATSTAYAGAKLIGCWDDELDTMAVDAIDLPAGRVRTTGNTAFANFTSADRFTVVVAGRNAEEALAAARGLLGRLGTTGWSLSITAGGVAQAKLVGSTATKTATGTRVIAGGTAATAPFVIGMSYDGTTLRVVDGDGQVTTATSGMGEIRCDELVRFTLGRASTSETDFVGQLARVYLWRQAIPHTDIITIVGDIGATLPGGMATYARTGAGYYLAGTDAAGALVACGEQHRPVWGYASSADAAASSTPGLVFNGSATNDVPTWNLLAASWTESGATLTTCDVVSPLGRLGQSDSIRITGDNVSYFTCEVIPHTSDTGSRVISFMARADVAHSITVSIGSDAAGEISSQTVALTTTWARYDLTVAAWGLTTAYAYVYWSPSLDGTARTFDLAAPIGFLNTTSTGNTPAAIPPPAGTIGATAATETTTRSLQHNVEGEIIVAGTCTDGAPADMGIVKLSNGTNDNDARQLQIGSAVDGAAEFTHSNATATGVTSETAAQAWDAAWTVRGRWARVGLLDAASAFAGVVFGDDLAAPKDYDVASAFTVSGAAALDLLEIGDIGINPFNGVLRSIRITSRETRLEP